MDENSVDPDQMLILIYTDFKWGKESTWASTQDNLSSGVVNNKGTDQSAHPRSLISAFAIRYLESIISKLTTIKVLNFLTSLCSWWDWYYSLFIEIQKTGCVVTGPYGVNNC